MRFLKLSLRLAVFFLCIGALSEVWYLGNCGFRIDKIKNNIKAHAKTDSDFQNVENIFNQKFKYLSKGCQTYVFESEDNKYVIKFIRFHRYRLPFWLQACDFMQKYKIKRQNYKSRLLSETLYSFDAAFTSLKDETATLYVHLNKTSNIHKKIQIVDRLHRKYWIDLDSEVFLLQKKVHSFSKILEKNIVSEVETKRLVCSFLQTTRSIYLKGYNNDDYNCIKNCGYIDNMVIHSDVGSFLKRDLSRKEDFEREFMHFVIHLKKWAEKKAPRTISYIDEEIKKMTEDLPK